MTPRKKLSNPFSTGGGGAHFEAHIQALFATLMLTGGRVPCFPKGSITEIKLQGKIDGYQVDDLIVFVKTANEQRRLLGQVKHSIKITRKNTVFGGVIQDAWDDFNNSNLFTKGKDVIALITGPRSSDVHIMRWLLTQARNTKDVNEFFRNVQEPHFSPSGSKGKLRVIQHHLKMAAGGREVSREELYNFLKHFHLINYDLGSDEGANLSLIYSLISQFQPSDPQLAWSAVVNFVQTRNQSAGTITPDGIPENIQKLFKQNATGNPEESKTLQQRPRTSLAQHEDASYLALAILVGSWNEKNKSDIVAITNLLGISYGTWQRKAQKILLLPGSPLSLKNGIWKVVNRVELWNLLGSYIFDQNLEAFKNLAISILKQSDPSFELPADKRFAANIYGKVLEHSHELREGMAEGLAILGSHSEACNNCSNGMAETTSVLSVREILTDINWVTWGSLNDLLPDLAEAAPVEFLKAVVDALSLTPCPFDQLFAEESNGVTGRNYLTGLLWALERLAWDEQYLVRVCVALGDLASHDPGGNWSNRPANSLATILMPWLPQTQASVDRCKVAIQTLLEEFPDVGLNLIIQLLPGQHQSSLGSAKPKWRNPVPDDWKESITTKDYSQRVSSYAELAVGATGYDTARLSRLVDHFDNLPKAAFDQLIKALNSQTISELPEDQRLVLWEHLTQFTHRHRRYSDAGWALSDELLTRIEQIADKLAPANPCNRYRLLFTDNDFELYDGNDNWEEQRVKLNKRREKAVTEIFQQNGIAGVIQFAGSVVSPRLVGDALGNITDKVIEQTVLPDFLNSENNNHKHLVACFIWRRFQINGWEWCDGIDKSKWTSEQIGFFLTCLPFNKATWTRATQWLKEHQIEYWSITPTNVHQSGNDTGIAIDELIQYGRPLAAIHCLYGMGSYLKQPINVGQCVRALLALPSSGEPVNSMDSFQVVELIKFLQKSKSSVTKEDLFQIEWAYLPLLDDRTRGTRPKLLETGLASNPEFFCEVIQLLYKSQNMSQPLEEHSEELSSRRTNALRLLYEWKTPPGLQDDGTFSSEQFNTWFQRVKIICEKSGHLEAALDNIGKVLIHAPADPSGLWIHQSIAKALNGRDVESMREGFRVGILNSRGTHGVDPTGEPERELAKKYSIMADKVENAVFHRLAATLKDLAYSYEREAERIIDKYAQEDQD